MDVKETAKRLKVPEATIRRMLETGALKINKRTGLITEASIRKVEAEMSRPSTKKGYTQPSRGPLTVDDWAKKAAPRSSDGDRKRALKELVRLTEEMGGYDSESWTIGKGKDED